ncbi:MAG: YlxR family protein [Lachnospiraceae bacterium]|nr:YlxR family protein [Lachnospiraceae bacterium]
MNKKIPMRQCIGCGQMKNKKEMMRILKPQEGPVLLDVTGKKNGRGAYLCRNADCLKKAVKSKGLERSFKMSIPTEVYDHLTEEFAKIESE